MASGVSRKRLGENEELSVKRKIIEPDDAVVGAVAQDVLEQAKEQPVQPSQHEYVPLAPPADTTEVILPESIHNETSTFPLFAIKVDPTFFSLNRQIERQYQALPWPEKIQEIILLTNVLGGLGDYVAAAKAIAVMQRICPTLTFDWVLMNASLKEIDPASFLKCDDPSKVKIRATRSEPPEDAPGDIMFLQGPTRPREIAHAEYFTLRKINGPVFSFMENAGDGWFIDKSKETHISLPMGLKPGTGVFLDHSRIEAPLSRGYCCPSYLRQIQDVKLQRDILEAMNVFDDRAQPDYDQFSFNSGYAHRPVSWAKFIDCVAIHEKHKHTVIVLNQKGYSRQLTTQQFQKQIFTPERLAFLKEKGYGTVVLKGQEEKALWLQDRSLFDKIKGYIPFLKTNNPESDRRLTIIIRPSFTPNDMKCMQLASERLLATGDNSAVESWCSRCKLFLYEDVANNNCKDKFLMQQVDLAKNISPNLSKLLALFGGDRRLPDRCLNEPLNSQKMAELEELLNDPNLSDATLQFCEHISSNYSFDEVLEAALKRTAWHHYIPELAKIEDETCYKDFVEDLNAYIKSPKKDRKEFQVKNLAKLSKRVQEAVQGHLLQLNQKVSKID